MSSKQRIHHSEKISYPFNGMPFLVNTTALSPLNTNESMSHVSDTRFTRTNKWTWRWGVWETVERPCMPPLRCSMFRNHTWSFPESMRIFLRRLLVATLGDDVFDDLHPIFFNIFPLQSSLLLKHYRLLSKCEFLQVLRMERSKTFKQNAFRSRLI